MSNFSTIPYLVAWRRDGGARLWRRDGRCGERWRRSGCGGGSGLDACRGGSDERRSEAAGEARAPRTDGGPMASEDNVRTAETTNGGSRRRSAPLLRWPVDGACRSGWRRKGREQAVKRWRSAQRSSAGDD
ncbi:hypothetical protein U1Q18_008277 [Sarracenia purpurea var. burkii]